MVKQILLNWMEKLGIPTKGMGFEYIKNTGWVTGGRIIESLISYIIIVMISRNLGAEGLGQYSFLFSFSAIFFIFANFGIPTLLVKDLSKKNKSITKKKISTIFTFSIVSNFFFMLIYFIGAIFLKKEDILNLLLLVGIVQFFSVLKLIPQAILRSQHKGKLISIIIIIERILALIGGIVAIFYLKSIYIFLITLLIASFIRSLFMFLSIRKEFIFSFNLNKKIIKAILQKAFPFLLVGIFSYIFAQLDIVMLSLLKNDAVVGWYNSGYRIISFINIFPLTILIFGFPLFSQLHENNKKALRKVFEKFISIVLGLIIPIIIGVFLFGKRIIEFIYQFNSIESAISFKILIVAEFFIMITLIMGNLISAANKQKIFARIAGFGAIFNIVLNLLLIPKFSLYGAGIATLITYVTMFLFMHIYIKKNILNYKFLKNILVILLSGIIMGFVVFKLSHLHLPIIILVGGIVYIISLTTLSFIKAIKKS